ncbi:hypothetical protein [Pyxidicoccus caerfyrddinensis]|uniref:hypothetical protein n=1 Tax=Pyxidicoccus caerfyrddinensis TaxID=2709663 RepID=UPI0013DD54A6|nr:hypothetical protein [Pyxidicoccus caerfyrddinensis]
MRNALMLGLTLTSLAASAAERWTAPYSLEDQHGRTFRVVLGEAAPEGVASRLEVMTLLGKKGLAPARFQRVEAVCADLCDSGRPTCHTVGVYTQEPGTADVGEGLAALAGRVEGTLSTPPPGKPEKAPTAKQWAAKEFQVPVDESTPATSLPEGLLPLAYRWVSHGDASAVLEERQGGVGFFAPPFQLTDCRQEQQPPFTRLTCPGASLLYAKQQLLFASFAEYAEPTTAWVATLRSGVQEVHLVRVGLKAQAVPGLLFRDGGRWRLLIRPADYPLLC